MDGLECREILYSDLEYSGRIDSEYYQKIYHKYETKVLSGNNSKLYKMADFLIGPFGSAYDTSNYTDIKKYRYIRGQDVKPFVLKDTESRYITEQDYNRLSKYAVYENDILVSVVGTLGNACIVRKKDVPGIFSCKSTVIRTNDINPYYLMGYLNCKYGKNLLLRQERGAIQKGLNLDDLRLLDIPLFSEPFQKQIELMLIRASDILEESERIYKEAENELINKMGLDTYVEPNDSFSIKSFSEVINSSDRIDAEFYQKKYDILKQIILNYDKDSKTLGQINKYIFTGEYADEYLAYSKGLKYFIRGTDIKNGYIEKDDNYCINPVGYSKFVCQGDIVTGRVGTVGNFAIIDDNLNGSLCSDNILCFRLPNDYIPEVYVLFFNLPMIHDLILRLARGSVQQRINQSTLNDILVPYIDYSVQEHLLDIIHKSRAMDLMSRKVRAEAVKLIEIAIELNEDSAIEFLENIKTK